MKISVVKKSYLNKDLSVTNSYYGYGKDKISRKTIYFSNGYSTLMNLFINKFIKVLKKVNHPFILIIYASCLITFLVFIPLVIYHFFKNRLLYEILITIIIPMIIFSTTIIISFIISFIGTIKKYNNIIILNSPKGEAFDLTDEKALNIIRDSAERYISDRIIECKFKGIDYNDSIQISIDNKPYWKRFLNKLF